MRPSDPDEEIDELLALPVSISSEDRELSDLGLTPLFIAFLLSTYATAASALAGARLPVQPHAGEVTVSATTAC